MPRFEPFRAVRYSDHQPLDAVVAPPYDVLSDADVESLLARHPANIVGVDVPRDSDGDQRYEAAADRMRQWLDSGVLVRDSQPSFTIYRMSFTDESGRARHTVGVLGALEVVDEGAGGVLPHERTTPKAKTDRLDLTRATSANLSPVWGLSLRSGLSDLLTDPAEPLGQCVDAEGVVHTVERVTDPARVAAIAAAVSSQPVLIADGHHRYAISRTFRDQIRDEHQSAETDAELTLTYVAELVEEQLSIDAIHRLYSDVDEPAFLAALKDHFEMSDAGPVRADIAPQLVERGCLCLVDRTGNGTWLLPRPDRFVGVRALDGALLEHALADVCHDVTYQHGVGAVVDLVATGAAQLGVLIRPTSITEIRRTADERLLMPPKSTFFTPKLRTGLVIRPLDLGSSTLTS